LELAERRTRRARQEKRSSSAHRVRGVAVRRPSEHDIGRSAGRNQLSLPCGGRLGSDLWGSGPGLSARLAGARRASRSSEPAKGPLRGEVLRRTTFHKNRFLRLGEPSTGGRRIPSAGVYPGEVEHPKHARVLSYVQVVSRKALRCWPQHRSSDHGSGSSPLGSHSSLGGLRQPPGGIHQPEFRGRAVGCSALTLLGTRPTLKPYQRPAPLWYGEVVPV